jgi:hypothetical protein
MHSITWNQKEEDKKMNPKLLASLLKSPDKLPNDFDFAVYHEAGHAFYWQPSDGCTDFTVICDPNWDRIWDRLSTYEDNISNEMQTYLAYLIVTKQLETPEVNNYLAELVHPFEDTEISKLKALVIPYLGNSNCLDYTDKEEAWEYQGNYYLAQIVWGLRMSIEQVDELPAWVGKKKTYLWNSSHI